MKDAQVPIINTAYTAEKFDDEILLYTEAGAQAVYLNDAAYSVWLLCNVEMSVGQIIQYLEETYPDMKEQIRGDVISALEMLLSNGVIEFAHESQP